MNILVVGCGAIGGMFAGDLAAVANVTAYDINRPHVDAINAGGLRVIDGDRTRLARIAAVNDPARLSDTAFDAILFMTKSRATGSALNALRPHLTGRPTLVTLQNGMGNAEVLLGVPGVPVGRGITMGAARYVGPGCVEKLFPGKVWIGPLRGSVDDLRPLGDAFNAAGMDTAIIADPMQAVWSKFVFNCVTAPLGALLLGDNQARYGSPEIAALIDDMAAECIAVARALGITFAFDPMEFVHKTRRGELPVTRHAGSMALDVARGVPTEIDEMTGFIVREGERLGVDVTACRTVYRLVKGLELAAANRQRTR